jgi:hypothetical protein
LEALRFTKPEIGQLTIPVLPDGRITLPSPLFVFLETGKNGHSWEDMKHCADFGLHSGPRRLRTVQPPSPDLAAQPRICPPIAAQQAAFLTFLRNRLPPSAPHPHPANIDKALTHGGLRPFREREKMAFLDFI